jgi:hypothetical protein
MSGLRRLARSRATWVFLGALLLGAIAMVAIVGPREAAGALGIGTEIRSIEGLRDGFLMQRPATGPAKVAVCGRVGLLAERIEVAVAPAGGALGEDGWFSLDAAPRFFFDGTVELPAGWHQVWVRSAGARGLRALRPVEIGVGEIFIVAGQSNAAGSSRTLFAAESPRVRTAELNDGGAIVGWRICADPQVRNGGGSVWPLVGEQLTRRVGVPVGFVNCAIGSTSINDWQPGQPAFERFANVARSLGPGGFRAILWHQGEADQSMSEAEYAAKLETVIAELRARVGEPTPWMVACASFEQGRVGEGVRAAQHAVVSRGIALGGPDTDGLGAEFREPADGVHFNAAGTRAAAALWTERMAGAFFRQTGE